MIHTYRIFDTKVCIFFHLAHNNYVKYIFRSICCFLFDKTELNLSLINFLTLYFYVLEFFLFFWSSLVLYWWGRKKYLNFCDQIDSCFVLIQVSFADCYLWEGKRGKNSIIFKKNYFYSSLIHMNLVQQRFRNQNRPSFTSPTTK